MNSLRFKAAMALLVLSLSTAYAQDQPQLKVGIIGLDTSHAIAFTKELNNPRTPKPELANCRVVAAYPKGSPDIESSTSRVPDYIEQIKKLGVEIVDSIDELLKRVDCVLLETNDGRPHLEQALPCFKAGKPTFIDKPHRRLAGRLRSRSSRRPRITTARRFPPRRCGTARRRRKPAAVHSARSRGCETFQPGCRWKDPSRSVLVRHSRRRIAVHRDGPRLRIGHARQDRRRADRSDRQLGRRPHGHLPRRQRAMRGTAIGEKGELDTRRSTTATGR